MHKKKNTRTLLSLVLSFFLAISILGICLFAEVKTGMIGKRNFKESLVSSDYIHKTEEKVTAEIKTLLEEKRIDSSIADDVLDYDQIYMDISNYIDAVYTKSEPNIKVSVFKEELSKAIYGYLDKHEAAVSDNVDVAVNEVVSTTGSYYETYVTPSFTTTFYEFTTGINQKLNVIGIVSIVCAIVIIILLICMYHYKHHALRYVVFSGITAVIVNGLMAAAMTRSNYLDQLNIGPEYYLDFLKQLINGCIKEAYIATAMCAAIVVLVVLLGNYIKKKSH